MIVDDRIELMDEVIKELEDYWYSEDPDLEDEIIRITKRDEELYVKDIFWKLEDPDVVTVSFGLAGFDGSNDRLAETREIEINFENFLGRDIEGDLVRFLSKRIKSLLDSVLHGGLYNEYKNMIRIRRSRKLEQENRGELKRLVQRLVGTLNLVSYYTREFEKYISDDKSDKSDIIDTYLSLVGNAPSEIEEILSRISDYDEKIR